MDVSAIICDEIVESYDEETKTIPINLNEKKATCKKQNFYILLAFLLITIALLIAFSINIRVNIEQNKNTCYHFSSQTTN